MKILFVEADEKLELSTSVHLVRQPAAALNRTGVHQARVVHRNQFLKEPVNTWADQLADEPCRLMTGIGKDLKVGAEVVVADYNLFLGDVDITEQDRVEIDSITYEVLLVQDRQNGIGSHHKECLMRTVR